MDKFTVAMTFISLHEWGNREDGAYTNNPADPGGETKYGISKRQYPQLDIRNLTLADAMGLYHRDYWTPAGAASMDFPIGMTMFDTTVNMGVGAAKNWLTQSKMDYHQFIELRWQKYQRIVAANPKEKVFLAGWQNRLNDLKKFIDVHVQDTWT